MLVLCPTPEAKPLTGQQLTTCLWPSTSSSHFGAVFHPNFQSSVNKRADKNNRKAPSQFQGVRVARTLPD